MTAAEAHVGSSAPGTPRDDAEITYAVPRGPRGKGRVRGLGNAVVISASSLSRHLAAGLANRYYLARRHIGAAPREFVFILGHMRSGSSLLTHLLADSPEICGYGETHVSYAGPQDLDRLICKVYRRLRRVRMRERYVLDKLLHDRLTIADSLLQWPGCRFIFLLRDPLASLASMVRAYPDWFTGQMRGPGVVTVKAANYYEQRLQTLVEYAGRIKSPQRMLLLTHAGLTERAEESLAELQRFLSLHRPLRQEYKLLRTTGQRGAGDFSANIRTGRILRDTSQSDPSILPPELVVRLNAAYETAKRRLEERCGAPQHDDAEPNGPSPPGYRFCTTKAPTARSA